MNFIIIKEGVVINMQYDKEKMKKQAENLENYLDIIENYVIIEGISEEEYKKAVKTVKKLIKKLKKGDGDAVYNKERYLEALEAGKLDI
jgi:stalled ribosome rescue protein Dom34